MYNLKAKKDMAKKRKLNKQKKQSSSHFTEEDFRDKHLVITQHAYEKWLERTSIRISKKRLEVFIRACTKQNKLSHYWKDFYIANDIVFIAKKKEYIKEGYCKTVPSITLKSVINKNNMINRWNGLTPKEIEKFALYYQKKFYSGYVSNLKKKQVSTKEDVYRILDREDIRSLIQNKKMNIYGNIIKKKKKGYKKIKHVRLSDALLNEYRHLSKDPGIVIVSIFGSIKDYPCLQDIKSTVIQKNRYGKMLF